MPVDPHSHVPIYEQITSHIRDSLAAGVYRAGDGLPSIRSLALEFLVNPNTVQRAYQELEREGLVVKRKGLGVFASADGHAKAHSRVEGAVRSSFVQGIGIGRHARIAEDRIQELFGQAMAGEHKDRGSQDGSAGDGSNR